MYYLLKSTLLGSLLLFSTITYCQNKSGARPSIVKINLAALADIFTFPTIQFSYEKKVSKKLSLAGEFGYQFYQLPLKTGYYNLQPDTTFISPKGYKVNIEVRYDLWHKVSGRKAEHFLYTGISIFNFQNKANVGIEYFRDSMTPAYDCFWYKKTNWGLCPVIGLQHFIKKCVIDIYVGAGAMYRVTENFEREYDPPKDALEEQRHNIFGIGNGNFSENNGWTVFAKFGVRFGILLN